MERISCLSAILRHLFKSLTVHQTRTPNITKEQQQNIRINKATNKNIHIYVDVYYSRKNHNI